jgi:hypothetical protein
VLTGRYACISAFTSVKIGLIKFEVTASVPYSEIFGLVQAQEGVGIVIRGARLATSAL